MPIVNPDDIPAYVTPPQDKVLEAAPEVVPPRYRSNIIDTRQVPAADLITHIEGSPWTVHYYKQVLGLEDEPSPPMLDQSGSHQQYIEIKNLEIRVNSDLDHSQNDNNEFTVTGSALTFPYFVPNVSDVFLADIGNGKEGIMLVTNVVRKSIFKESVYEISYTLMMNTNDNVFEYEVGELKRNIEKKVVKTYFYNKNFLQRSKNPLLVAEEHATLDEMRRQQRLLLDIYLSEFYSEQERTIAMPVQCRLMYDQMLVQMLLNLTNASDHPLLRRIRPLNTDDGWDLSNATIWNMLLEMDDGRKYSIEQRVWGVSNLAFTRHPMLRGIYHTRFKAIVYPYGKAPFMEHGTTLAMDPYLINDPLLQNEIRNYILGGLGDFIEHPTGYLPSDLLNEAANIHPVRTDDYYVFTRAFYDEVEIGQSKIELMTRRAISGEAFNTRTLVELCHDIRNWEPLDRFYYIPVLLALIKKGMQII